MTDNERIGLVQAIQIGVTAEAQSVNHMARLIAWNLFQDHDARIAFLKECGVGSRR